MSTNYPGGLDTYPVLQDGVDTVTAAQSNDRGDAINAIETALGLEPAGTYPDVASALNDKVSRSGDLMSGPLDMGGFPIVNLALPGDPSDAATLGYVSSRLDPTVGLSWRDDFLGARAPNWTLSGNGGTYTQNAELGGTGTLSTGATISNSAGLDFGGHGVVDVTKAVTVQSRARIGATTQVYAVLAGLYYDADNLIEIYYDVTTTAANFLYRCISGGTASSWDSNLAADTSDHEFRIDVDAVAGQVKFTIDGTNAGTLDTNLPTSLLEPRVLVQTREAVDKSLTADYFQLDAAR